VTAGLLSYLVPGLGQIVQGRVSKGLLFVVCLYGLFFYGMYLGEWKNVYLPDNGPELAMKLPGFVTGLYYRPQYAGQFWIGVVAWPALWQYDRAAPQAGSGFWQEFQRTPPERVLNQLQTDGDKTWDLGWVLTVVAGVLNILVIYDAAAGPAYGVGEPRVALPAEANVA
jgi:hypothetical protein